MKNRPLPLLAGVLALGAFVAAPALAQSEAPLDARELEKDVQSFVGRTVQVEGKFKECWGGRWVRLRGSELRFYLVRTSALAARLRDNKDGGGRKLVPGTSNVLLSGVIVANTGEIEGAPKGTVFRLDALKRLADDIPRFDALLAAAIEEDPDDPDLIHEVADQARAFAARYPNAQLVAWAFERDREAVALRARLTEDDDFEGLAELAEQYVIRLADQHAAIAVLDKIFQSCPDEALKVQIEKRLKELDGRFHRGRWLPFAALKKLEGYVLRRIEGENRWLRREKAEFLDQVAKDSKRRGSFFVSVNATLQRTAESGELSKGMLPSHIVSVKTGETSLGFPYFVERRTVKVGERERVYTQWTYPEKRRFYFVDGRLFSWFDARTPWPEE